MCTNRICFSFVCTSQTKLKKLLTIFTHHSAKEYYNTDLMKMAEAKGYDYHCQQQDKLVGRQTDRQTDKHKNKAERYLESGACVGLPLSDYSETEDRHHQACHDCQH